MSSWRYTSSDLPHDVEEDHPGYITTPSDNLNVSDCVPTGYTQANPLAIGSATRPVHAFASNTRSVFERPIAQDVPPPSNEPYVEYKKEAVRLETFHDWPSSSVVTKEDLAKNGFIYLHTGDRVQCIFCRAVIRDWEAGDIVAEEHKKFCPECPFAFGFEVGNIPLPPRQTATVTFQCAPYAPAPAAPVAPVNVAPKAPVSQTVQIGSSGSVNVYGGKVRLTSNGMIVTGGEVTYGRPINTSDSAGSLSSLVSAGSQPASVTVASAGRAKYSNWERLEDRIKSYTAWPQSMGQTPIQLAEAGLIYMGTGDRCKCNWCGGELYDWDLEDDPWEEHAKWFSDCGFVRQQKGEAFVQYVKDKQLGLVDTPPADDIFSRPQVLAVLQSGYSRAEVESVLRKYGPNKLLDARTILMAIENERSAANSRSIYPGASEDVTMQEVEQETPVKTPTQTGRMQFGQVTAGNRSNNQGLQGASGNQVVQEAWQQSGGSESISKSENQSGSPWRQATEETAPKAFDTKHENSSIRNSGGISQSPRQSTSMTSSEEGNVGDVESLKKENEKLKDQKLCKICLDKELCITFIPCGHLATCDECCSSVKECPICRNPIQSTLKTFWS